VIEGSAPHVLKKEAGTEQDYSIALFVALVALISLVSLVSLVSDTAGEFQGEHGQSSGGLLG
jgi:hypothetical protein